LQRDEHALSEGGIESVDEPVDGQQPLGPSRIARFDGDLAEQAHFYEPTQRADSPTTTILVVDDNRMVTKALSSLIRDGGYQPIACHSGADALAFAEAEPAPAAAVVDIHLPDINGLILSHKLRERFGAGTPIIVVSGDTSMETIKSLPHVGATYFFPKPVNATLLMGRLKELIDNSAAQESV
jgi:CheY-like chemotaxis protein